MHRLGPLWDGVSLGRCPGKGVGEGNSFSLWLRMLDPDTALTCPKGRVSCNLSWWGGHWGSWKRDHVSQPHAEGRRGPGGESRLNCSGLSQRTAGLSELA